MKKIIKVDKFGRIVLPISFRKKYFIKENDNLILICNDNGFSIKKDNHFDYYKLINKFNYIYDKFDVDFVLFYNYLPFYSGKYKEISLDDFNNKYKDNSFLKKEFSFLNSNFIICFENKNDSYKLIDLVISLL